MFLNFLQIISLLLCGKSLKINVKHISLLCLDECSLMIKSVLSDMVFEHDSFAGFLALGESIDLTHIIKKL